MRSNILSLFEKGGNCYAYRRTQPLHGLYVRA